MRKDNYYISLFFSVLIVKSQQAVMFSQYYTNNMIYNPAISGSLDYNPLFTFQSRQQWLGFEGCTIICKSLSWCFK